MGTNNQALPILSVSSLLLLLLIPFAAAVDLDVEIGNFTAPAIDVPLCNNASYPALCDYAARTYRHRYKSVDPMSLLAMHVDMATEHTKAAQAAAQRLLSQQPREDSREKAALVGCVGHYSSAVEDIARGYAAAEGRDLGTACTMLASGIAFYTTCDSGFDDIPATNPLAKQDEILSHMLGNALALAKLALPQLTP